MVYNYKEYPVLAKLAGALWFLMGLAGIVISLYVLSKTKGEWVLTAILFATSLLLFVPGYRVIFNKIKGLVLPSCLFIVYAIFTIYDQVISDGEFVLYGIMLLSGVIALIGNKKYKTYIISKKSIEKKTKSTVG